MNLFLSYSAAACFAALTADAAEEVVSVLKDSAKSWCASRLHVDENPSTPLVSDELVRQVMTEDVDLWFGAIAEPENLTVLSLGVEEPDERMRARHRAVMRAHKRPTIGGLSLEQSPASILESVRALMEEQAQGPKSRYSNGLDAGYVAVGHNHLAAQLTRSARRWRTTQARNDFKVMLDEASTAPQVVERDGQEVLIIDRGLLERFERPLSGAQLAARFASNHLPRLKLIEDDETEPDPDIHLGARV